MISATSFLIVGGTGRQGGAVVDALLADKASPASPDRLFVLTRNKDSHASLKLTSRDIQLVQGNLSNPHAIFEGLKSRNVDLRQTAVFLAQAHGPSEVSDACGLVDAAVAYEVQYLVYSSVDRGGRELSDRDPSYCKTFADKYEIEKYIQNSGIAFTILRPTWFADNAAWGFPGRLCMAGWRTNMHGKRLQITATKDIGRWAVEGLVRPDASGLRNSLISIASDSLTFAEVDAIFREETGETIPVTYEWLARLMIWAVKDLRTMFAWIDERDYGADMAALAKTVEPTSFRAWVRETVKGQS